MSSNVYFLTEQVGIKPASSKKSKKSMNFKEIANFLPFSCQTTNVIRSILYYPDHKLPHSPCFTDKKMHALMHLIDM
jgi:hypothetical protein